MQRLPILHIVLFVVTFGTTLAAGALQAGIDLLENPMGIVEGFPFAVTLITILLVHEFSHYAASRKHHTAATLPYFIPAPSIIGTFGAFIKMKAPIPTRAALIDIGASGPIAGLFVSIAACVIGLSLSSLIPAQQMDVIYGKSLLFSFLADLILGPIPVGFEISFHLIAFAGWIGLFVTSINLFPIGQLDGGHVSYALFGKHHNTLSYVLVGVLAALGTAAFLWGIAWEGWLMWAVLMVVLGLEHPPVLMPEERLDPVRRWTGIFSFVVFIVTFVPAPFQFL